MTTTKPNAIILFDGVCNFCNGVINFIIQHDPHGYFHFASLQSPTGQQLLQQHNLNTNEFDTFILIENDQVYDRSTAALKVARHLSGWMSKLHALIIVPKPLRDMGYSIIAKNRYRLFGKSDACMVPTPDVRSRFMT